MNKLTTTQKEIIENLRDELPSGSGINFSWSFEFKRDVIECHNSYETMTETGFYCCVIPFTVSYRYDGVIESIDIPEYTCPDYTEFLESDEYDENECYDFTPGCLGSERLDEYFWDIFPNRVTMPEMEYA